MTNYTLEDMIAANVEDSNARELAGYQRESAAAVTLAYMKQAEAEGQTPYDVKIEAVRKYGWTCGKTNLGNGLFFSNPDGIDMPTSVKQRFSTCCKAYDRGVRFAEIETFSELTPKKANDPTIKLLTKHIKDMTPEAREELAKAWGLTD